MEKKRWKTVSISTITLLILTLLVFLVFREDYKEIVENICSVRITGLMLVVALGVLYQTLDSAVCYVLIRSKLPCFTFLQAIRVTYLGVFGSVSTFSVGCIPMQSYYLHCCGLTAGSGIGVLMLEYVLHKSSILIYATGMLLIQGRWFSAADSNLLHYILFGYIICVLIIAALILLCTWKKLLQFALWGINHFPNTEKWRNRKQIWAVNLNALYTESQETLRSPRLLGKAIVLNGLKLFCFYSIPFCCFRIMNLSVLPFWRVQLLASLMYLITNALPNVAGMGPTEFAFILIFSCHMEYAQASSALILYRIATFFFPFILSIFVFLATQKYVMTKGKALP